MLWAILSCGLRSVLVQEPRCKNVVKTIAYLGCTFRYSLVVGEYRYRLLMLFAQLNNVDGEY